MKKLLIVAAVLPLWGCAALNLNPTQQANLALWIQAGKTVVQASTTLFCEYEPTTVKLIQVFDTSTNTAKNIAKVDAATLLLCNTALANGAIVK